MLSGLQRPAHSLMAHLVTGVKGHRYIIKPWRSTNVECELSVHQVTLQVRVHQWVQLEGLQANVPFTIPRQRNACSRCLLAGTERFSHKPEIITQRDAQVFTLIRSEMDCVPSRLSTPSVIFKIIGLFHQNHLCNKIKQG